jgi:hypothetical protein
MVSYAPARSIFPEEFFTGCGYRATDKMKKDKIIAEIAPEFENCDPDDFIADSSFQAVSFPEFDTLWKDIYLWLQVY